MTNERNTVSEDTQRSIEEELLTVEREIAALRLSRERNTYRLEQALREHRRLGFHLLQVLEGREEGAA